MRTVLKLSIFGIFSLLLAAGAQAAPRVKHVKLEEFTRFSLDVVPDYGTLLVFPFVLDDGMEPPLQIHNTNEVAFNAEYAKGQYTILVTAKTPQQGGPMPSYRGLLYVTVGGYNVTIELRTTNKISRNYSNVIFQLSPKKREYLIAEAVKRRSAALEAAYRKKVQELDRKAEEKALAIIGQLVRSRGDTRNVKADIEATLPPNVTVSLFADKWQLFRNFAILRFEVENRSPAAVAIDDVKLITRNDDTENPVTVSAYECDELRLAGDSQTSCTLSMLDLAALDADEISLVLVTDRGEVKLSW